MMATPNDIAAALRSLGREDWLREQFAPRPKFPPHDWGAEADPRLRDPNTVEFDLRPMMAPLGVDIRTSEHLTETVEDWSGCRSPSRARRRLRQGCPQRVKTVTRPRPGGVVINGVVYMHPIEFDKLKARTADKIKQRIDQMAMNAFMGKP